MNQRIKKLKTNKGITLIALVITIIVLLLLAGVSIAMLTGENGILTQATNAKIQTENAGIEERIALVKQAAKIASYEGKDTLKEELKKEFDLKDGDIEEKGKILIFKNDGESYSTEGKIVLEGQVATEKTKYISEEGKIAIIPKGFKVSEIEGEKKIDEGLVVIAPDGSEFVWVPVDKAIGTTEDEATSNKAMALDVNSDGNYRGLLYDFSGTSSEVIEDCTETIDGNREPSLIEDDQWNGIIDMTTDSMQKEYNAIVKSVSENGGFYIGRYETSLNENDNAQVIKGVAPIVARNTWYGVYKTQQDYSSVISESEVKSSMIYGSMYDTMLNWALMGKDKVKVTQHGNADSSDRIKKTGETEDDKINNIYDLEGNLLELTAEAYNSVARTTRGGMYGSEYSLPAKRLIGYPRDTNSSLDTSRIVLYL